MWSKSIESICSFELGCDSEVSILGHSSFPNIPLDGADLLSNSITSSSSRQTGGGTARRIHSHLVSQWIRSTTPVDVPVWSCCAQLCDLCSSIFTSCFGCSSRPFDEVRVLSIFCTRVAPPSSWQPWVDMKMWCKSSSNTTPPWTIPPSLMDPLL